MNFIPVKVVAQKKNKKKFRFVVVVLIYMTIIRWGSCYDFVSVLCKFLKIAFSFELCAKEPQRFLQGFGMTEINKID